MSSNPFRKKALGAIDTARAQSPAKSSLRSNSPLAGDYDDDADNPRRPKPVKKVRVLSPPPLSPDSPEWPSPPPGANYGYGYSYASQIPQERHADPFNGAAVGQMPPPANPFSKTLQDLESSNELESQRRNEGEALKKANAARQSLNVDSFRRLLMTGKATDAEPVPTQQDPRARADSATSSKSPATDSSRVGRAEEESDSPESSDTDDDCDDEDALVSKSKPSQQQRTGKEKKAPPPPPSSRHGKSLRDGQDDTDLPKLSSPREVNKPLPPSPIRMSMDDDSESPFDRESAGKVPEPEPAGPESHSAPAARPSSSSSSSRKSAPAPPPRRGHSRTESKSQVSVILSPNEQQQTPTKARGDETSVRTSTDEAPSRSDGARQTGHAPAPPPPRRPYAAPRQTSHASSLSISSSQVPQTPSSSSTYQHESDHDRSTLPDPSAASPGYDVATMSNAKLSSPPPPPPARNPSVRRPPSISSVEGISWRVSGEGRSARDSIPPPPPRRQRGSSSPSSVDVPPPSLRGAAPPDAGKGVDILADLDALQREVDALRGKFK
ncbi:Uncharacterized protein TCAP_05189 [Tolypocladium capitatum]|uniref:Uncharacterized protein n=1 Tax=Tolypocladium capitatum TaxID=45235 RepID=A0A2K3QBH3_9HYPO|nr:Uncharacterized protein TCAP_05189 [Tolypocladium capitatum]